MQRVLAFDISSLCHSTVVSYDLTEALIHHSWHHLAFRFIYDYLILSYCQGTTLAINHTQRHTLHGFSTGNSNLEVSPLPTFTINKCQVSYKSLWDLKLISHMLPSISHTLSFKPAPLFWLCTESLRQQGVKHCWIPSKLLPFRSACTGQIQQHRAGTLPEDLASTGASQAHLLGKEKWAE